MAAWCEPSPDPGPARRSPASGRSPARRSRSPARTPGRPATPTAHPRSPAATNPQTHRPQRIVTVTRAATRVGARTAGKPQEPCMNHEIGDVAEGACLRSEPGIDVAIEDPAHLCRSIWPRTPEIAIRSGNPWITDGPDIGSQRTRSRWNGSDGVLRCPPGTDIRHAATLAATHPGSRAAKEGPDQEPRPGSHRIHNCPVGELSGT